MPPIAPRPRPARPAGRAARALLVLARRRRPHARAEDARCRAPRRIASALDRQRCTERPARGLRARARRAARIARLTAARRAARRGLRDGRAPRRSPRPGAAITALVAFDDTGPARCSAWRASLARLGDPQRALAADELDRRFGTRSFPAMASLEGVPVGSSRRCSVRSRGAARHRRAARASPTRCSPASTRSLRSSRLGVVARIRAELDRRRSPAALPRAACRRSIARVADDARSSARGRRARRRQGRARPRLGDAGVARSAGRAPAGPHADLPPPRRRRRSSASRSTRRCSRQRRVTMPRDDVALARARRSFCPTGASPTADLRTLAQVPLGEAAAAPLARAREPGPVAGSARRGRSASARAATSLFTSALAIALGLGLLATIRGAARARELAQLKSDFVSTVSHELKTPLTSIRMFAEMLEQGVAKGDADEDGALPRRDRAGEPAARPAHREPPRLRADRARHPPLHPAPVRSSPQLGAPRGDDVRGAARAPGRGQAAAIRSTIDVSPEAMTAEVEVDRDVVVQAVLNLLANAAKYGGAGKPIEVAVDADATRRIDRGARSRAGHPGDRAGADLPRVLPRARGVSLGRRGHRASASRWSSVTSRRSAARSRSQSELGERRDVHDPVAASRTGGHA